MRVNIEEVRAVNSLKVNDLIIMQNVKENVFVKFLVVEFGRFFKVLNVESGCLMPITSLSLLGLQEEINRMLGRYWHTVDVIDGDKLELVIKKTT